MKKLILLLFIAVSHFSFAQTKDLQQSIDSFRTVLNKQDMQIKQLQAQVYHLSTVLNTVNNSLNEGMNYSKADSAEYANYRPKPKTVVKKTVVKANKEINTAPVIYRSNRIPKNAKYYKTINGNKYYIERSTGRKFIILKNGRIKYVPRK